MDLAPQDITIAVTVFSRREFVLDAIRSALNQTVPVKVIVVEDCGPDAGMREFVTREFDRRIEYFRNHTNRGLFDNWNASMEYCRTPWLSILHDDDELRPNFVQTVLDLAKAAPQCAAYFGRQTLLEADGSIRSPAPRDWSCHWRQLDVTQLAESCLMMFPGQLFHVESARKIGGFRKASYLTGDWDLWFRLALEFGAAQSEADVAITRAHEGRDRGSTRVERMGWKWALDNVQRKRNLALLRSSRNVCIPFVRAKALEADPIPSRLLLRHAHRFSRRILLYNWWLLTHSQAPSAKYAALQWLTRLMGPQILRFYSSLWNGDR